jgi:hypothetical protein
LNTAGGNNTAIGFNALFANTTGGSNTAIGTGALEKCTTGTNNIAVGLDAGDFLTTGDSNIYIGVTSTFGGAPSGENQTTRIGDVQFATYISGISGKDATGGEQVFITSDGKLGTINIPSSARFKDEIKPMNEASEVILALKPVTFRYKKEFDPKRAPQFGLVAEEVEKVNPDLVKRDRDGKLQTVRYEAVNAMLLNEFLKARRQIDAQQKQIDALTAGLQKVSAQVEASKPSPQVVNNNQ